ncbi:MAG TPA: pyrroline-5-carboxylate reductase [Steroidobacteraceae bacterium]|jgi:pyrroline-5-carboxylate reductase|nr:pyrroline-5-carboxylate reductase [Steroidobacteraceae bacterium]
MNNIRKMAFIGGGNMAAALIGGLTRRGLSSDRIVVADPSPDQRDRLARTFGVHVTSDNVAAVKDAEVVILAVKPQMMRGVVTELAPHIAGTSIPPNMGATQAIRLGPGETVVISIAAGIPHAALARWLGSDVPVIRTMPNRPALNGFGATGLYAPRSVGAANRALAEMVMAAVSAIVWVEHESQMDTVTALSGSGPAYFFLFMEALEAAAHERGLPKDIAHQLTLETALGAAQMARQSTETLATLREQVTSKGGTTAAALAVLDTAGLQAIVARAVAAADRRSAELAAEFGVP